jgi:sugar phosphate isomerase/epimerase
LQASPDLRASGAHQFIHQAEELLTLLKSTSSDNLGLALDTWHWTVGGGGRDQLDELEDRHFVSIVLADVPGDVDLSSITVRDRAMPSEATYSDHARLTRSLAQRNYRGPVTIKPHSKRLSHLTRDQSVEACARALDEIWTQAGLTKSGRLASPAATDA